MYVQCIVYMSAAVWSTRELIWTSATSLKVLNKLILYQQGSLEETQVTQTGAPALRLGGESVLIPTTPPVVTVTVSCLGVEVPGVLFPYDIYGRPADSYIAW